MEKLLERHKFSKLTQEEILNLTTSNEQSKTKTKKLM